LYVHQQNVCQHAQTFAIQLVNDQQWAQINDLEPVLLVIEVLGNEEQCHCARRHQN
jgi:hypothetical protein